MKKIVSLLVSIAVLCSTIAMAHPFKDVNGHWADAEIEKAFSNSIISGDPDGRFRPEDTVSRAEFLKMLVATICQKAEVTIPEEYDDKSHWAAKYYNFARLVVYTEGAEEIDGVTPGVMTQADYDIPITRWEMAYMMSETMRNVVGYTQIADVELDFADADKVRTYPELIENAVKTCYTFNLMKGDEKNLFNPSMSATRAEAVTVVNRVDGILQGIIDEYNAMLTAQKEQLEAYEKNIQETQITYEEIPKGNPTVTFVMENNKKIVIRLFPKYAPQTVANFVKLVKDGFYDGLTFHRIVKDFVAQGGDPNGDGTGGSEGHIKGEFLSNGFEGNTLSHTKGVISMARSNHPDSASSQFFICLGDTPELDGQYAAFGKVIQGMDVLEKYAKEELKMGASGEMSTPVKPVVIKKATVSGN